MLSGYDFDSRSPAAGGGVIAAQVHARLEGSRDEMTELLGELVAIESPSDDPEGLRRMAGHLEELFSPFGEVVGHRLTPAGPTHLLLSVPGTEQERLPDALVVTHYDTVWDHGTLDRIPFAVDRHGRVTGPGCFDMKGGIALLFFALRELEALGRAPRRRVKVLFNGDEEIGTPSSRPLIEQLAEGVGVAYVLEPPLPGGVLKTARKGSVICQLRIDGRASHSGLDPKKGASAIVELAHQIQALSDLSDPGRGTTVNVGVVRGGTRLNVVAAHAEADVHIRVATKDGAGRIVHALAELRPVLPGTRVAVDIQPARPPMERTPEGERLFQQARSIAAAIGVELEQGTAGGGSDGNLVAALGIPVLDGLGPDGDGAHADDEHVLSETMPSRAALLAGLLADV
jgi:glutamate carboxypeptidase